MSPVTFSRQRSCFSSGSLFPATFCSSFLTGIVASNLPAVKRTSTTVALTIPQFGIFLSNLKETFHTLVCSPCISALYMRLVQDGLFFCTCFLLILVKAKTFSDQMVVSALLIGYSVPGLPSGWNGWHQSDIRNSSHWSVPELGRGGVLLLV